MSETVEPAAVSVNVIGESAFAPIPEIIGPPLAKLRSKQDDAAVRRMDLLEPWRHRVTLPFVRGRLLDLACGYNNLTRAYGSGIGADVFPWEGIDVRVGDASRLPFRDESFDTVSVLAALNHIPNRDAALEAVRRVLCPGGHLLVTMIGPWTGRFAHLIFHQDENRRGGMRPGELDGISPRSIRALLRRTRFELVREVPFQLGLNRLYVARKAAQD